MSTPHSRHRPRGSPRLSLPLCQPSSLCLSLCAARFSCLLRCAGCMQPAFVLLPAPDSAPLRHGPVWLDSESFSSLRVPFFLRERLRRAGRGGSPWGPAPPCPPAHPKLPFPSLCSESHQHYPTHPCDRHCTHQCRSDALNMGRCPGGKGRRAMRSPGRLE